MPTDGGPRRSLEQQDLECKPWKDPSVPNRINSLIFSVLSLCLGAHVALAQSSIPRTTSGGVRPAAKKSTVPPSGGSPRTNSLPQTTRAPAGRVDAAAESAEDAAPAQKPAPRLRQPAQQGPAAAAAVQNAPGVVVEQVSEEMKEVLQLWEQKTAGINTLYCPITRYEFDKVFGKETRSRGKVYFENPDKGRIDFQPAEAKLLAVRPGRELDNGTPFTVIAGSPTQWICTGKFIYIKDMTNKTYDKVDIPPQMQGKNITHSPLPFIFGMKADDAIARFKLTFGPFHNPDGTKVDKNGEPLRKVIHIVANPKDKNVAKEYIQAEIVLDTETFLPLNLRTTDPSGNKETVYSFTQAELKVGCRWGLNNPFSDPLLVGWTLNNHVRAQEAPVQKAELDKPQTK